MSPHHPPFDLGTALDHIDAASLRGEGAKALLCALLDALDPQQGGPLADLRPLRAHLHLRDAGSYRALLIEDRHPAGEAAWEASRTAWAAIERSQQPVDADVETGTFGHPNGDDWTEDPSDQSSGFGDTSLLLKARDATHLLALPLRQGRSLRGMVTLELSAPDRAGQRLPLWPQPGQDLARLARHAALDLDEPTLTGPPDAELPFAGPALRRVLRNLDTFARMPGVVLLIGETGTGKTRLARRIHERSPRKSGPFVCADLHACDEDRVETELFGVARGTYTGVDARKGRVEEAQGGTLFIDELDSLSWRAQTALLGLLSEGRYRRVGEARDQQADVRVIVGASPRLLDLVTAGQFRQDLYRRVEFAPFRLPPLRERPEELPGWIDLFLQAHHQRAGGQGSPRLAPEALALLQGQRWPGNLRELDAVLYRAYGLATQGKPGLRRPPIGADAVRDALSMGLLPEGSPAPAGLEAALARAAEALLADLPVPPPDLKDIGAAFAGALVEAALREAPEPGAAAERLGRRTKGGQHLEAFRTYTGHLDALRARCGLPIPTGRKV